MSLNAFLPVLLALLLVETAGAATAGALVPGGPAVVVRTAPAMAAAASETAEAGRWHEHQLSFTYSGFTTKYSCDGLADKLRSLLRSLGARPDLKVTTYGCAALDGGPTEFPRVKLRFATLQPGAAEATATPPTAGAWRWVHFDRDRPRTLELGDCELLEQFRDRVLPLFSIRSLSDHTRCIPYQLSGTSLSLSFEVFAPLSTPDAARSATR